MIPCLKDVSQVPSVSMINRNRYALPTLNRFHGTDFVANSQTLDIAVDGTSSHRNIPVTQVSLVNNHGSLFVVDLFQEQLLIKNNN
jgi:hypothetical protein